MFRNRKTVIVLILVFSILSFLYLAKGDGRDLSSYFVSKDEYDSVISTRNYNYNLILDEISLDGYSLVRDNNQNLYYSMIEGNSSASNPKLEYQAGGLELILFGSEISDYSVENNEQLKLVIYNEQEYNEYNLVFTKLPIMSINLDDDLAIGDTVKGNLFLFDNRKEAASRVTNSDMEISIRGHMSLEFPKSSYRITLTDYSLGDNVRENNLSLLGLRKDADYVLYADFNETEKIRNVFTSNLWKYTCAEDNSYGLDNGIEYKYLELIVNGEYEGLYALGYKIDGDVVELGEDEIMYKLQHLHTAERDLNLNSDEPLTNYEVVKTGENVQDEWQLLREYYKALFAADENNYESLYELADIENTIDYFLFINMVQGIDNWWEDPGALNNCYLTMKKNENGSYSLLMTPWDFDKSWATDLGNYEIIELPYDYSVVTKNCVAYILSQYDEGFKERVKEKYWKLREDEWSMENMDKLISEYEEDIFDSGAFLRDEIRWPDEEYTFSHHSDASAKLYSFRTLVKNRLEKMDEWVENY